MKYFLIVGIMAFIASCTNLVENQKIVYVHDTIYIKKDLPLVEIPHPVYGRVIVDLRDSSIILTAGSMMYYSFETQKELTDYLYQEFDGININRRNP